jgi:hypothetical protein
MYVYIHIYRYSLEKMIFCRCVVELTRHLRLWYARWLAHRTNEQARDTHESPRYDKLHVSYNHNTGAFLDSWMNLCSSSAKYLSGSRFHSRDCAQLAQYLRHKFAFLFGCALGYKTGKTPWHIPWVAASLPRISATTSPSFLATNVKVQGPGKVKRASARLLSLSESVSPSAPLLNSPRSAIILKANLRRAHVRFAGFARMHEFMYMCMPSMHEPMGIETACVCVICEVCM